MQQRSVPHRVPHSARLLHSFLTPNNSAVGLALDTDNMLDVLVFVGNIVGAKVFHGNITIDLGN
jgi:hypothetical protein